MLKQNYIFQQLIKLCAYSLLIIIGSTTLSACGNKGDLYLPEKGSVSDSQSKPVKKKS